jgi:hypothetical protein
LKFKTPYEVFYEKTGIDASLLAVVRLWCESTYVDLEVHCDNIPENIFIVGEQRPY